MSTEDETNAAEWRTRMLNAYPEETLIRASGTYLNGGTFTNCWARPVPAYISGQVEGADQLWEVLVFGSFPTDSLTTSDRITAAELLYSAGYGQAKRLDTITTTEGTPS